mmetsp:Transcript_21828/g.55980  ORF Transcript_21828/g.55980 Transcript_21828/m.55980 type:complete len:208 (-) Transcript_21828:1387-2010(-)
MASSNCRPRACSGTPCLGPASSTSRSAPAGGLHCPAPAARMHSAGAGLKMALRQPPRCSCCRSNSTVPARQRGSRGAECNQPGAQRIGSARAHGPRRRRHPRRPSSPGRPGYRMSPGGGSGAPAAPRRPPPGSPAAAMPCRLAWRSTLRSLDRTAGGSRELAHPTPPQTVAGPRHSAEPQRPETPQAPPGRVRRRGGPRCPAAPCGR